MFLLAGVSYYKTAAPPVIDLGPTALTDAELAFLREFYLQGLGEFAYRNTLDLTPLRIEAHRADVQLPASGSRRHGNGSRRHSNGSRRHSKEPSSRSAAGSTRSWSWSGSGGWPTPRCSW